MRSDMVNGFSIGAVNDITVLFVDDDAVAREHATRILDRAVGTLLLAENAQQALELFDTQGADIVVTDLVMPGMDGLELAAALRKRDEDIPIFVATGTDQPEMLVKAVEQNIDQLLLKPLLPDALLTAIRKTIRLIAMRRRLLEADDTVRMIMDTYPNFVLMTEGREVSYVNESMLAYLGHGSFEDFVKSGQCVGDHVSEVDGTAWEGGDGWISAILDDPLDREHRVHIPNLRVPASRTASFTVGFKEFPMPGRHLVTLTDVTELEELARALEDQATTDPLTGTLNRRSFLDMLADVHRSSQRFCLIMFDIDHFKLVNDSYGHDVGDTVLEEITRLVQNNVRSSDALARWGGEEFMVLTPDSDVQRANRVAERLRRKIEGNDFTGVPKVLTSSFGVVAPLEGETTDALIKRVDEALYQAKEKGRNRVVVG